MQYFWHKKYLYNIFLLHQSCIRKIFSLLYIKMFILTVIFSFWRKQKLVIMKICNGEELKTKKSLLECIIFAVLKVITHLSLILTFILSFKINIIVLKNWVILITIRMLIIKNNFADLGPCLPRGSSGNMSSSPIKVGISNRFRIVSLYLSLSYKWFNVHGTTETSF